MRKGDKKVFLDTQRLAQMLNLRRVGYSFPSLGIFFTCDWTSPRDQCHKYGIRPLTQKTFDIRRITLSCVLENNRWRIINGERINRGKSYKDYFR